VSERAGGPAPGGVAVALHEDFAGVECRPGESHLTDEADRFALVNVLAFGGAPDRPTHVPAELARLGPVVVWESTGSSLALPFWNTNFDDDAWLYLVQGSVRIEFKEPETTRTFGHQLGRTGDLLKLPRGVAHRTFSGDGKRRISLELLSSDPRGEVPRRSVRPDDSGRLGELTFEIGADVIVVRWPGGELREPRHFFGRALRALVSHDLHLFHNEFLGGLVVNDHGEEVTVKAGDSVQRLPGGQVQDAFAGLLARLD
jgi:hypothetical protein